MAVAQRRMSEAEYEAFINSGVEGSWELHDGRLVEKPGMSWRHHDIITEFIARLHRQLDRSAFRVFTESRVRRPTATIFLPDVAVVPAAYGDEIRDLPELAIFSDPLPLVIEVWSPSTGDYDVNTKIPIYQKRGDLEIWRIHPYERTLTRWVRQADGTYRESVHRSGTISPTALPQVTLDLDTLFDA
jgi:Uma2 family endonuclease